MTNAAIRSGIVAVGSGRVGRAVATRLASFGFAATANYAGPAGAQEVVAGIKAATEETIPAQADVAKAADVEPLLRGRLRCLEVWTLLFTALESCRDSLSPKMAWAVTTQ
jgi:hypothetical protein